MLKGLGDQSNNVKEQQRLFGIDLFRGLAIFAVIIVHVDEGLKVIPPGWSQITALASFCVSFFLATAFYLAVSKLYTAKAAYPLRLRLTRLLIPYGAWSILYLLYKATKYVLSGSFSRLVELFQDPLSLIFFGGISFHLYFLPLLATGTLLVKLVEFLIARKISLSSISLLTLASLLIYEIVLFSGNTLRAPANVAFEPLLAFVAPNANSNALLRWLLVEFFWALKCFPYVMVAMILAHPAVNKFYLRLLNQYVAVWVMLFLVCNAFGSFIFPEAFNELICGYTALFAAISLSSILKENFFVRSIGLCSFGIYLVHLFFTEIFQSTFTRLYPNYVYDINALALLLVSVTVLLISWGTTILLMKSKNITQVLFGF